jgi:hypothetical protein
VNLLLGIVPDLILPLPEHLAERIEYQNHVRSIRGETGEDVPAWLKQFGFNELSTELWLKTPTFAAPQRHITSIDSLLDRVGPSGQVPGLEILDPATPVRYYRGRWTPPKLQSGRFVGRRPQAYGSPLWCYLELREGNAIKLIDLPLPQSTLRGCDEAWRIQAAIDAAHGDPQEFRVLPSQAGRTQVDFFSPVPLWAERRWNAIGERVRARGALFSYRFSTDETAEEVEFAQRVLWLVKAST